jgi:deoxyribonuclease V
LRIRSLHDWGLSPREAIALQRKLAGGVRERKLRSLPRLVAGVDCGYSKTTDTMYAAVVLCRLPARRLKRPDQVDVVEEVSFAARPPMPYVPGLLSFREAPAVLECFRKIGRRPEAVLVDGQGRAHPRRLGLASHLGLFLGVPTAGCAKSVLVGEFREPAARRGSRSRMRHGGETVGLALRTRSGVKPVYVSVGHLLDLSGAARLVLGCSAGYRLPEPTRLAHHLGTRARLEAES